MLQQLLELVRKENIFRWNLYYAGISFRKTSRFLADFERFGHESVRVWYHKMSRVFTTSKKYRGCIAVDETKIKIENRDWYVWAAIDVDSWEIVGIMVTEWRTSIDVIKFA
ncbi:MAG: IS6 family transposase, partial [Thermoplasmata archaeon]|nr:IS6 family transposase [Thermoplasmata archaeon]